ncbi:MAG: methyltransferase domain-containing protein [Bradyrhizobium sp.]
MHLSSVQSFYERMPYPPPLTDLDRLLGRLRSPDRRRANALLMFPQGEPDHQQRILVAGCGTSQAAQIAVRKPDARVVAIDISETSLECQRALQQKYALDNLELHQLSILDVASLDGAFDQIICTGVLHHLPDPDQGLRCLHDALAPWGAMQIMVYASYGRAGIYMMQEYCRRLGVEASGTELEELGATLTCLPDDHPLGWMLHRFKDFLNPHALADALLHPQDRAYTVPQVYAWLDRCGMVFGRWTEQAPYLPQCGSIARTPHAKRLGLLSAPDQHAAVELLRGVIAQHSLIAYRNDRAALAQPVEFAGEQWRDNVPVRVPWTNVVRDRVPAGSVAVLLNPVHRHADLVLPIDRMENELLARIDGKSSFGEIAQGYTGKEVERRVVPFFRKLWQYDQILVDVSRTSGTNVRSAHKGAAELKHGVAGAHSFESALK